MSPGISFSPLQKKEYAAFPLLQNKKDSGDPVKYINREQRNSALADNFLMWRRFCMPLLYCEY